MLLALFHSGAVGLHLALFAAKILFLRLVFDVELLLAVNHAAEVGLFAVVAFVEGALVHGKSEKIALVMVASRLQALIVGEALVLSGLKCKALDFLSQIAEDLKLCTDLGAPLLLNLLLALRAGHESEGNFERIPAVLQKLKDAVGVEEVAASKLHASLRLELAREADGAKLTTLFIEAGKAIDFVVDAIASLPAVLDFLAPLDQQFVVFRVALRGLCDVNVDSWDRLGKATERDVRISLLAHRSSINYRLLLIQNLLL